MTPMPPTSTPGPTSTAAPTSASGQISTAAVSGLVSTLAAWQPRSSTQDDLRREYLAFVQDHAGQALDREGGPEHITGSCFVFTPDLRQVLLCYHRKGRFWVQLGGHVEAADASVAAGALREAREEGGIADLVPVRLAPLDVDRHALSNRFGRCTVHWDVGFGAIAPEGAVPVTSEESEDVAWWPVDALPSDAAPGLSDRLRTALAEITPS